MALAEVSEAVSFYCLRLSPFTKSPVKGFSRNMGLRVVQAEIHGTATGRVIYYEVFTMFTS